MLELNLRCESVEEARVYLNAHDYLNLLSDFYGALRNARKHGTDADVLAQIEHFMPDLTRAIDHSEGAY